MRHERDARASRDYEVFTQVQLKTGVGDEYFVADMVLVKRQTNNVDGIEITTLDLDNAIVVETKLNYGTNLTTPQSNGLTKIQSNDNVLNTRSVEIENLNGTDMFIRQGDQLKVNDFIKVWSDGTGNAIEDVISLK